ncbi:MAG: thioredoxin-disulfide reductase [Kiritimatiellae bacterium]|nr:thioredoxin-disulfide reductase [Kiritimatiellia bacterium]
MEKLVIVGSGPAGLTAAIYAARAALEPLVLEGMQPGGQLMQTTDVENFPGFIFPIPGPELVDSMHRQAARLGARFLADALTGCDFTGEVKELTTMTGKTIKAEAVILATGATARWLGIEGKYKGRGVSTCATCDGAFYKGKRVAVIGGGETALTEALYLSQIAAHVTLIHRRDTFRAAPALPARVEATANIDILRDTVPEAFLGERKVEALRLRNVKTGETRELPLDGVFVAIGHAPETAVLRGQVALDELGYIEADGGRTSVPGVFAAGDVQERRFKQAVTAAASGCVAALEAERYLQERN